MIKKDFKELTKQEVIQEIVNYIKEQNNLVLRKSISEEIFLESAWSEHQAYFLGMQKAFSKILDFIPDQEN